MVRAFVLASIAVASIFLGWAQPSCAQATTVDPRWGLLAELAERDFHTAEWGGSHVLYAFRWEDPGRQLSMTFSYVGTEKTLFTLDSATGEILMINARVAPYGEKYGIKVKAAADGTILWSNGKPYLSKGEGGAYELAPSTLIANEPGDAASQKVEKFVAAGKLRAANPGIKGAVANAPIGSAVHATASLPAIGAAVELNAVQRAALDRYMKDGIYGGGRLQTAHWNEPGKSFVVESVSAAGHGHINYVIRSDGLLVLSPEDEAKTGYGLIGQIDAVTGIITIDWHQNGQLYRSVVSGVDASPEAVQEVTYQGVATRNKGTQWTELSRIVGAPYSQQQLEGLAKYIRDDAAMKASPWGVLSVLPGTLWYCIGDEPEQWLHRRRMYQGQVGYLDESIPLMRFTVATWREPGRVLEVVTKLGDGRGWTDVIELKADGSFTMNSTGVSQYASLAGHKGNWGQVVFPVANYTYQGRTAENYIEFGGNGPTSPNVSLVVKANDYPDPSTCLMQAYDAAQLPQLTKDLRSMQEYKLQSIQGHINARQEFDADAVAGQQMIANMRAQLVGTIMSGGGSGPVAYSPSTSVAGGGQGASFLQDLQAMADTAHREAERSRAQLDTTIAQAQAGGRGPDADSGVTASANPSGAAVSSNARAAKSQTQARSSPSLTKRTLRAFFQVQLVQRDDDDHNAFCQSTVMNFTIDWDSNDPNGNFQRENAALDPLVPTFISKCEAARKTFQQADYYVDDGSRPLQPKVIRHGDVEVVMP